ncbi:MAG: hypothetical protein DRI84_04930 [Bacteroidetes bacterium]|nr:MAG: hypothetical protein DRI84_04930 [Bacteroidota bacterium]
MYHLAKNNFSSRINAFNVLTHGYVYDEQDEETRSYLKKIIITAHKMVTEKIKDEDIDFDIYDIVTIMIGNDKPYMRKYLKSIDPDNLTEDHYVALSNVIASMIADNYTENE